MNPRFEIDIEWEQLEHGSPEERAAFGAIGVRVDGMWLTEAHDRFVKSVRQKVHLSGYRMAEWLAWNWWRLRWETTRPRSLDWQMAHRLATIGGGYVWPPITCSTDGEHVLLQAAVAQSRTAEPIRYVSTAHATLAACEFEAGVDEFINLVLERLRSEKILDTNLERIWRDVLEERSDREAAWYRRLEAEMGFDPDEGDPERVQALIEDASILGEKGVAELAAASSPDAPPPRCADLLRIATSHGQKTRAAETPRLLATVLAQPGSRDPAWVRGEHAAIALRHQEKLGGDPLSDELLAALAGTDRAVLTRDPTDAPFSFALCRDASTAVIVLQSAIRTNRRFALARLVGDRIFSQGEDAFVPIMRSFSFRQKQQRAFAAELLCPFDQAIQELDEDLGEENQERVASKYEVSPMVVRTQLVNKGHLGRDVIEVF